VTVGGWGALVEPVEATRIRILDVPGAKDGDEAGIGPQ
jgi:hypothetical protein